MATRSQQRLSSWPEQSARGSVGICIAGRRRRRRRQTNGLTTRISVKPYGKFSRQPLLLLLSISVSLSLYLAATISLLMSASSSNALGSSLKMSVSIPELVKLNDAFWLNCSHNQQQQHQQNLADLDHHQQPPRGQQQAPASKSMDDIYAIKWYKDDEEFYRFLPNAHPKVSIYETNGIQLDQAKSHEGNVLINKADVNSEGNYRCEILSEAPLFETVRKSKHLKVYALPVRGPRIEILDASGRPKSPKAQEISYAVGDKIELRCNSAPSKPAARLRWYLNEHELPIPAQNGSSSSSPSTSAGATAPPDNRLIRRLAGAPMQAGSKLAGYDVRVTPIEYRQHYKGIYSSHSTLSLVLQQDDLINNKISFKCLASMRQEIPLRGKQLIVLMPGEAHQHPGQSSLSSRTTRRRRRSLGPPEGLVDTAPATLVGAGQSGDPSEAHVYHRQRPQHHRHSVSRLQPQWQQANKQTTTTFNVLDSISANNLLQQQPVSLRSNNMLYIYEDSDSTLGPSIIDGPENLEAYLRHTARGHNGTTSGDLEAGGGGGGLPMEFNRADNLEYIQLMRERSSSRQQQKLNSQATGNAGNNNNNLKRLQANSLVRSPLYLDENDPMRPIISWPPLDSGKLILLGPGNTLVAIPTVTKHHLQQQQHQKFILPPRGDSLSDLISSERQRTTMMSLGDNNNNLEGSVDTRLSWLVNESPLEGRDTRFYPTRVSPDHRQTWITIGLQPQSTSAYATATAAAAAAPSPGVVATTTPTGSTQPISLQTILAQYSRVASGGHQASRSMPQADSGSSGGTGNQQSTSASGSSSSTNAQIKFICQAIHSMLLYSSSEMITFDFNPPPPTFMDTNSIEKMASSPSNVIQATSASQSSSAPSGTLDLMIANQPSLTLRSQTTIIVSIMSFIVFIISLRHPI